nr:hypothetical protein [uncultured Azospirillum sp.]
MKTGLFLAAITASLAVAPAAMAQQSYSQSYSGSQGHSGAYSGSTGGDMSRSATMGSAGSSDRTGSSIAARRGPGQKPIELRQTTLLNQLSASGFVAVRDFRKEGERYIANAMTPQGEWTTVILDPRDLSTTRATNPVR